MHYIPYTQIYRDHIYFCIFIPHFFNFVLLKERTEKKHKTELGLEKIPPKKEDHMKLKNLTKN